MDAWFKYIPQNISQNCFENIVIEPHMSVDDIISIALELKNCLIELYKGLVRETEINEVRDIFSCLLERIKKEEKNLVRDSLWLNDI